jgi:hypothetical protein
MEPAQTERPWSRPGISVVAYVLDWLTIATNAVYYTGAAVYKSPEFMWFGVWAGVFGGFMFLAGGKVLGYLSHIEHHLLQARG